MRWFVALLLFVSGVVVASPSINLAPIVSFILDDDTNGPVTPPPPVDPNLIPNSGFEVNSDGWFAFGPMSVVVETSTEQAFEGMQSLKTSGRMNTFEGPATDITSVVTGGERYTFSAYVRISSAMATDVRATMKSSCMAGDDFSNIATVSADNSDWVEISSTFTLLDCAATKYELYFEGPGAGVDIFIDEVRLEVAPPIPNLIANGDFETGTDGWFPFGAEPSIQTSTAQASKGNQSLLTTGRVATFQGPATSLNGIVTRNSTYDFKAQVRISTASETVQATLQVQCPMVMDQFIFIGDVGASNSMFNQITGSVTIPDCEATALNLYFQGPGSGTDIFIDEVSLTEAP